MTISKYGYVKNTCSSEFIDVLWVLMKEKATIIKYPVSKTMVLTHTYDNTSLFNDKGICQVFDKHGTIYEYNDKIKFTIYCIYITESQSRYIIDLYIDKKENMLIVKEFMDYCRETRLNDSCNLEKLKIIEYLGMKKNREGGDDLSYINFDTNTTKSFDNLFFIEKDNVLKRINFFLHSKEAYINMGRQYSLGILLSGEPGTGKSSFIKALSKFTGRHLILIPLNRIKTCAEFTRVFVDKIMNVIDDTKKIIVFEDADCMSDILFDRAKYGMKSKQKTLKDELKESITEVITDLKTEKSQDDEDEDDDSKYDKKMDKLSLSHILNMFDGLNEGNGRIIVMTSNHIDKLDPALLRPGRFDIHINFTFFSIENILQFINTYYHCNLDINDIYMKNRLKNIRITGAKLMNLCEENPDDYNGVLETLYFISNQTQEKTECREKTQIESKSESDLIIDFSDFFNPRK